MDDIEAYKQYLLTQGAKPEDAHAYGEYLKTQHAPQPAAPQATPTGAGEAALQGFGEGGTLGYLPQVQAATGAALSKVLPESMGGGQDNYADLKKYFEKRNETLKSEHPIASTVGNVAGTVATMPIAEAGLAKAGLGMAKEASLLEKMRRASLAGAAYGGAANPEVESTDADPHAELKKRLENAGIGMAVGGVGEGLIGGIGSRLEKSGEKMSQKAVVKQIGANAGQIKKILQKDEIPKIEGLLTNEGLITPGKSVEDVADHTAKILQDDGPKIGELYNKAQADSQLVSENVGKSQGHQINGPELADEILANAKAKYKAHANRDIVMKEMESAVAPLRDMGDNANIVDIHNYRKSLDENINWAQKAKERDAVQNAFIDARNIVADKTKTTINALDKTLGGDQLNLLKKLNDRYSAASTVNNIATQGVARETAKAFMGHGVIGAGAGAGAATIEYNRSHDPLKALGVGAATALGVTAARKFGAPIGYYGGKAVKGIGQATEALTPSAEKIGAGLTSPWVNMQKKREVNNGR